MLLEKILYVQRIPLLIRHWREFISKVIPNGNTLDCLLGNARQSAVLISSSLIICEVTFAAKVISFLIF